jgi:hypothetical protein
MPAGTFSVKRPWRSLVVAAAIAPGCGPPVVRAVTRATSGSGGRALGHGWLRHPSSSTVPLIVPRPCGADAAVEICASRDGAAPHEHTAIAAIAHPVVPMRQRLTAVSRVTTVACAAARGAQSGVGERLIWALGSVGSTSAERSSC